MTWSYSGDPSASDKDHIRYIIGDTKESMPLLSDEEIMFEFAKKMDVKLSALECVDRIIASLAQEVSYTIGPEHVAAGDKYKHYLTIYRRLQSEILGAMTMPINTQADRPACFDIGMTDNK